MLFKKLKLKNIRSYIEEEIKFPEGITLLSGDIGSGKTTILLAVDFALFGIRRGELSGSTLLRNGANEGYVILNFSLDNTDISIKRTLRKTNNGIVQDSGFLTINDITQEVTPVEIKQKILQLLNYPQEYLTKKFLMYKYTVYTPQDEMKLILLGEKEDRLQTLRKVFNIDKYKRVKDNSKIIISEVKQKKKEFLGFISDLDEKKQKFNEKETQLEKIEEQIVTNKLRLETTNNLLTAKRETINQYEQHISKLNNIKRDIEILSNKFMMKEEQKFKNNIQLKLLERQIVDLDNVNLNINIEELKKSLVINEKISIDLEEQLRNITNNVITLKSKKQQSNEIKTNITRLDFCPLCRQNVSQNHKHELISKEETVLLQLEEDIINLSNQESELKNKIKNIKKLIQEYKNLEVEYEVNKLKQQDVDYKKELLNNIKKDQEEIENSLDDIITKKKEFESDINELKDVEEHYKLIKEELQSLVEQQKKIEIIIASSNREYETIEKESIYLLNEIEKKEKAKQRVEYYIKLQDWLENFFAGTLDVMERKIMLKVHSDFNNLFKKWFNMLIESDLMTVKLDEEFTPLIEQNSHDIEYENLSGGEKTACALAYRLALNQVINNIVSSVKTKDLIILDEPTDGFSSEQLDKIRPLLKELKMKQIIIVSHESKIESFVDNIIKIKKEEHISKVIN